MGKVFGRLSEYMNWVCGSSVVAANFLFFLSFAASISIISMYILPFTTFHRQLWKKFVINDGDITIFTDRSEMECGIGSGVYSDETKEPFLAIETMNLTPSNLIICAIKPHSQIKGSQWLRRPSKMHSSIQHQFLSGYCGLEGNKKADRL